MIQTLFRFIGKRSFPSFTEFELKELFFERVGSQRRTKIAGWYDKNAIEEFVSFLKSRYGDTINLTDIDSWGQTSM